MQVPDKKKIPAEGDQQAGREKPGKEVEKENENVAAAYQEASKDIEDDPDLSSHSPNDDLDEGESARLGENTDLA